MIRLVADQVPQAAEKYVVHEELYSHHQNIIYSLDEQDCNKEHVVRLEGFKSK
jgi:hypothetical protein